MVDFLMNTGLFILKAILFVAATFYGIKFGIWLGVYFATQYPLYFRI